MTGRQAVSSQCRARIILASFAGLGLASMFGADSTLTSSHEFHTFTNQNGKTIQAAITDAVLDTVILKRDDGQSFKVPIATLSKDDQEFISQWVIQRAKLQHSDILRLAAAVETGQGAGAMPNAYESHAVTSTKGRVGAAKIKSRSVSYNITITSLVPAQLSKLEVRYIIFTQSAIPGGLPPNDFATTPAVGNPIAIDDLAYPAEKTVATRSVTLADYSPPANFVYTNNAPLKISDRLQGIWVRVYNADNEVLQEWASSDNLIKENNWDTLVQQASDATATQRGGFGERGMPAGGGRGRSGGAPSVPAGPDSTN